MRNKALRVVIACINSLVSAYITAALFIFGIAIFFRGSGGFSSLYILYFAQYALHIGLGAFFIYLFLFIRISNKNGGFLKRFSWISIFLLIIILSVEFSYRVYIGYQREQEEKKFQELGGSPEGMYISAIQKFEADLIEKNISLHLIPISEIEGESAFSLQKELFLLGRIPLVVTSSEIQERKNPEGTFSYNSYQNSTQYKEVVYSREGEELWRKIVCNGVFSRDFKKIAVTISKPDSYGGCGYSISIYDSIMNTETVLQSTMGGLIEWADNNNLILTNYERATEGTGRPWLWVYNAQIHSFHPITRRSDIPEKISISPSGKFILGSFYRIEAGREFPWLLVEVDRPIFYTLSGFSCASKNYPCELILGARDNEIYIHEQSAYNSHKYWKSNIPIPLVNI